ncbi:unnamed protein product [Mytilus coruscus]|uniref:EGF-like domain-containing protein n=1 Tax=Mytilus coruscus TaxID=42192 RepID=A0A6J8BSQ1_MYTCO|nr:unnamed protein product [Mytilus coruscus]
MAELEMQEYEQLNRNKETTYDVIKVDKGTIEMNHLVIQSWSQFFKNVLLILIVSLFSAGVVSIVTYFTICAQLEQKLADIDRKLAKIEKKNMTKLQETDNKENTYLDNNTMCYNGKSWQRLNDSKSCVCAAGFLGKQCEYSDGKDTSFMVVFHEGVRSPMPTILVASESTARLSVLYFNNNTNQSITIDKNNTEYILSTSVLPSDGIHMVGVEIHSDVKINVYGFLNGDRGSEGYLSMPMKFASTKYIIPTLTAFTAGYGFKNLLALLPIYQNTAVRTLITASKPVFVVSGNQCNYAVQLQISKGGCQPFIELILPTDQLDNIFITPHISTRLNNTVRIQTANSTKLNVKFGNRNISKTLKAREYWDFYYNTTSFIFASNDILVMSYPHGLEGGKGDPFMMTIPGVNQYLYEYDFAVPTGFDSFISITVKRNSIDGVLLDGEFPNITSVLNISEGRIHYSTFSVPISDGAHHIEHRGKVRFGLWVYGNRFYDVYGYPAGLAYKIYH